MASIPVGAGKVLGLRAVTVATLRSLPAVRALAASFQTHHPDDGFVAILVDADPTVVLDEPFQTLTPHDLEIGADALARMMFIYDANELCDALRPWAIEAALDGAKVALLIAPESRVLASLNEFAARASTSDVVLTPHRLSPVPDDDLRPTAQDIMAGGLFNLGLCAMSSRGEELLTWWKSRMLTHAIWDPANLLFGGQRWMDWAPTLFDCDIVREPGLNVGYWNVDECEIGSNDPQLTCSDESIRLFQFTGFDPEKPWQISKYVTDNPRVLLSEYPHLRSFYAQYADELRVRSHETHGGSGGYRYGVLPGSVPLQSCIRREYRRVYLQALRQEAEFPPVPDPGMAFSNLQEWFEEPSTENPRMSRYSSALWHSRIDLQRAFTFPENEDFEGWQQWLRTDGVAEKQVPPGWDMSHRIARRPAAELADTFGVNLFGYFTSELGLGETGRLLVRAVEHSEVPHTSHIATRNSSRQQVSFRKRSSATRYPINVVAMAPGPFVHWMHEWGSRYKPDSYTIGVWAWELERFPPEMAQSQQYVDEVWAVSAFVRDAIQASIDKPVHVFPHPVVPRAPQKRPAFVSFDDHRPYFAFTFDYLSDVQRKNPRGLIEAFTRAFPGQDGPRLVVKSMNGSKRRSDREMVLDAAHGRRDIVIIDDYLSLAELDGFIQHALAYVSLHRAEGLGLGMLEAMGQGVPTIATGYSGNLDFMTDDTAILIPYTRALIGADAGPYAHQGEWAEPDLDAAVAAMRNLAEDPAAARQLGERGRQHVMTNFSVEKSAQFVGDRLREVFRSRLETGIPHRRRAQIGHRPALVDEGN